MIPAAGFSLNDFFATARFAITVYDHIQLGHSAPQLISNSDSIFWILETD